MSINNGERNNRIIEIIKNNNFIELKNYIQDNGIQIKDLNNENFDILIYSIENDASINIIEYIISHGKYKTLNYTVNEHPEYKKKTPLLSAIGRNNFKTANYLIEYGADIDYIIQDERKQILSNFKNVKYILSKGMNLNYLIFEFIINNENYFLFYIFNYFIYNNDFILNFLTLYKKQHHLSNLELKSLLNKNKSIVEFNKYIYETAIKYNNYEAIAILYDNDTREHELIIKDFYYIFNQNEVKKNDILEKIKNPELKVQVNKNFLKDLENIVTDNEKNEHILSLIKSNNIIELKNYLIKYDTHIMLNEKLDKQNGILKYCIENGVSLKMIDFLIEYCQNKYFNYDFYLNINGKSCTFLGSLLIKNQFKYFDFFIKKGADINYGALLTSLYEDRTLNSKNIKYVMNNNKFILSTAFINHLITDYQNVLLKNIIQQYIYNNIFILNLLSVYKNRTPLSNEQLNDIIVKEKNKINIDKSMYETAFEKNNYEILDFLYRIDWRESNDICNDLFHILEEDEKHGYGIKKTFFVDKYKNNELKIAIDDNFLNNLETLEDKRKVVIEHIKMNKIDELKKYMEDNHLLLSYFNNEDYDILIYAIVIKASIEMLEFIIQHYKTLNYYILTNRSFESPLFCALSINRYKFADVLIKHGASINYVIRNKDIIFQLYYHHWLNESNLKYILNKGFNLTSELIESLVNKNINNYSIKYNNNIISILSKYYTLDNDFILNLLTIFKYNRALSKQQLQDIIMYRTKRLPISYKCYHEALCSNNNNAINWFFNHISSKPCIYLDNMEIIDLLHKAAEENNYIFMKRLLTSKIFDFQKVSIESFLAPVYMSVVFGIVNMDIIFFFLKRVFINKSFDLKRIKCDVMLAILAQHQNYELMKLIVEEFLHHKTFDFNSIIKFEDFLFCVLELNYIALNELFINEAINHRTFDLKNINYEKTLQFLVMKGNIDLLKIYIEKSVNHETFDFNNINFESTLLVISQLDDHTLIKLIIDMLMNHKTFTIKTINIERDLLILRQMDNNILILEYFIKELLNCKQFNIDDFNIKTILLTANRIESDDFMKFIIDNLLYHETFSFNKSNMRIKKILLIADELDNEDISKYFIDKVLSHKTLELNHNTIENILFTCSRMHSQNLIEFIIEKTFNQENFNPKFFDINFVNFNKLLVSAEYYGNTTIMKYIIEKLLNIDDIRMINFENIRLSKFKKD